MPQTSPLSIEKPQTTHSTSNARKDTLLTAKAHGGVMEGLLILLPCQAKTFRLQVAVVVRLITCQKTHKCWMLKPNLNNKKKSWCPISQDISWNIMKHHEMLGMSLIRWNDPRPIALLFAKLHSRLLRKEAQVVSPNSKAVSICW